MKLERSPTPWLFDFLEAFAYGGGIWWCLWLGEPPVNVIDAVMGCCP